MIIFDIPWSVYIYSHTLGGLAKYRAIALHTSFMMGQAERASCAILVLEAELIRS